MMRNCFFLRLLHVCCNEIVDVARDACEDGRRSHRAASSAAERGDADLHVPALAVLIDQWSAAVTLEIHPIQYREPGILNEFLITLQVLTPPTVETQILALLMAVPNDFAHKVLEMMFKST